MRDYPTSLIETKLLKQMISLFLLFCHALKYRAFTGSTYFRKFCRFPKGMYSMASAIGSDRVQAPNIDTILGCDPIRFIKLISASKSSLYDNGALSVKKERNICTGKLPH